MARSGTWTGPSMDSLSQQHPSALRHLRDVAAAISSTAGARGALVGGGAVVLAGRP